MEYDIIVKPGGNPNDVQLAYEGIEGLKVTENGDLQIVLKEGSIIQKKPVIYQEINGEKVAVDGRFKIQNAGFKFQDKSLNPDLQLGTCNLQPCSYTFEVASYDKSHALVIDPVIVWSTYLGGGGWEMGVDITVDTSGNAYIVGTTRSDDFPVVSPIQGTLAGGSGDVFVTKIDASGSKIVYSTYLGGSGWDWGSNIVVDAFGNAYITGLTNSVDFPTFFPIQGTFAGGWADAFVTKIDASGSSIVWSTYLGGSGGDSHHRSSGMAVDTYGNVYVVGSTWSTDFPLVSPIQGTLAGGSDVFVTKIDTSGSKIVYSTYLGGNGYEDRSNIAVDASGNAYITGLTSSTDFPIVSPIQGTLAGGSDAFVTKIDTSGSKIVYSTYLGGSGEEYSNWSLGIAVDTSWNVYVAGGTSSTDFHVVSSIQGILAGGSDAFVTKINAEGNNIVYSTYLGGSGGDWGFGIAVDTSGNAYVVGATYSTDFPTLSPIQGTNGGNMDAFVTKINAEGNAFVYSTYIGGSGSEDSSNIAVDTSGNTYVVGTTSSTDFPMVSPIDWTLGGYDAFIAKIGEQVLPSTPADVVNVVDTMLASGEISSTAIANSIVSQLSNAQEKLATNPTSAENMLNAVINFIEAQSGKKITTQSAETLIKYLTSIINGL